MPRNVMDSADASEDCVGQYAQRLLERGFEIRVEALPEDISPSDSFSNREDADQVAKDMQWNAWAFFTARLVVSHPEAPGITGDAILGACSYKDGYDFLRCNGDDMAKEAVEEMRRKAISGVKAILVLEGLGD